MKGILLLGKDDVIESRARRAGTAVQYGDSPSLPFEKTLITVPGTRVPWDLLPTAWDLLEHWDAMVPLWCYNTTAANVGSEEECKTTKSIVRDLRVLLHAYELLFIRKNAAGSALMETWKREMEGGGEKRLAFLRALYQVKPRLCILPTSWLVNVRSVSLHTLSRGRIGPAHNKVKPLVLVELEPGRFVKCHIGDEERVRAAFSQYRRNR
jgi:hypothetical protein